MDKLKISSTFVCPSFISLQLPVFVAFMRPGFVLTLIVYSPKHCFSVSCD